MRNGRRTALAAALAALVGLGGTAATAQVCFPPAGGVPGEGGGGPPDWWDAGAAPVGTATSSFLDDPRWRGAASDDDLEYERFRVIVDHEATADYLVMSWEVNADATGAGDDLYFGLWDDTAGAGNVYRLTRNTATQTAVAGANFGTDNAYAGRIFKSAGALGAVTWSGTEPGPPYPLPAWLTNDARVDVSCASPPSTGCDRWAFRVRAPIDPAANTGDATPTGLKITKSGAVYGTFRFWYEIQDNNSIGTVSEYAMPAGLSTATETGGIPPIQFPDPSGWKQAKIGSGAGCDGDILFEPGEVYVNSVGSTTLNLTSNTFHATPLNHVPVATRPSIPDAALTARFRIANWGSAGLNSPAWLDTCTSSGGAGSIASGSPFDLSCTWSGFDSCPYKPAGDACGAEAGTKDPHQCVLVDLGLPSGSVDHFFFSPQSVFQNMNFDVNSKLVRHAAVDIRGLGAAPGGGATRDVYLYVHTRNMPARIPAEPPPPPPATNDNGRGKPIVIAPARQRFPFLELPAEGPIGTKESARIQAAVQAGKLTFAQVEQLMPTYVVYVWTDSGKTVKSAGGPKKMLQAQPSFGLFLAHDGTLDGWKHELAAA
ncbi:MAG TPA: hypothetical protein VHO06_27905, partial [Polyangia bacterium]|nr:hypothetical protein [Polyangia bacterium]